MDEKKYRKGTSQKRFKIPGTTKYYILRKGQRSMTAHAIFSWKKAQLRRKAEGEGNQVSPLILTRARR